MKIEYSVPVLILYLFVLMVVFSILQVGYPYAWLFVVANIAGFIWFFANAIRYEGD